MLWKVETQDKRTRLLQVATQIYAGYVTGLVDTKIKIILAELLPEYSTVRCATRQLPKIVKSKLIKEAVLEALDLIAEVEKVKCE